MDSDDGKKKPSQLHVPEPPTGLRTGFLTEYWQLRRELPTMRGTELLTYHLGQAVHNVLSQPLSSAITILTMAISLFLLAGFLLLLQNFERVITFSGSSLQLTAYLKDPLDDARVQRLLESLRENPRIRTATLVTKTDALTFLRSELGAKQSLIEGLEDRNPLPASIDIVVRQADSGFSTLEQVVEQLRSSELIDEVAYGSEWVDKTRGVLRVFRIFAVSTLLVTLFIVIFLIANTIKLVIYARRDEVSIMQLVGATPSAIRSPFVLGGLTQGVLGSLLGLGVLRIGFWILNLQLRNSTVLGVAIPDLSFLSVWGILGILCLGAVVGAVGSFSALGRFMHV